MINSDLFEIADSSAVRAKCEQLLRDRNGIVEPVDVDYGDLMKKFVIPPSSCHCFEINEGDLQRAFPKKDVTAEVVVKPNIQLETTPFNPPSIIKSPPSSVPKPPSNPTPRELPNLPPPSRVFADPPKPPSPNESICLSDEDDFVMQTDFQSATEVLVQEEAKKRGQQKESTPTYMKSRPRRMGLAAPYRPVGVQPKEPDAATSKAVKGPENPMKDEVAEKLKGIDKEYVEKIQLEMMGNVAAVSWDDISGLEYPKSVLLETVVMPQLRPDIFTGLLRPAKGILLFGPPGTGKTLIGKCIASQSNSKFFSISASTLTSKWIGDGEKLVKALFAVAAAHQPSVVFIDEIDSMLSKRSENEHESSRRLKTEFMTSMDGASTNEDDRVLVIGATNRPQELDDAIRRRLQKRLYIPLPDQKAREDMLHRVMAKEKIQLSENEVASVAKSCDGYSGADMKSLCKEAALETIRCYSAKEIQTLNPSDMRPASFQDFQVALKRVKPTVDQSQLDGYSQWNKSFGSCFE